MKALKIFLLVIAFAILVGFLIKGSIFLYRKCICEPEIYKTVKIFLTSVGPKDYNSLDDSNLFLAKEHFQNFKKEISKPYSAQIMGYYWDNGADVLVKFDSGAKYGLVLVPCGDTSGFLKTRYKVLTVR